MIKEITQKESERTKELECLWELLFLNLFSLVAPEDLDLSSSLTLALSFSPPLFLSPSLSGSSPGVGF